MQRLLAALAASLPPLVLAAPAGQPSFSCSAGALDAYAPGNWYCGGDLTIADGTLSGESLIFVAKDNLTLKNVRLQGVHILLSAATVSIDGSNEIDFSGALTAADGLVPALGRAGYSAVTLSSSMADDSPVLVQPDLTHIWYDSHAIVKGMAGGVLTWSTPPTISLVPEPAGWQFAILGAGVLTARRLRRATRQA